MPALTTHILDLTHGQPAAGVAVEVYFFENETEKKKIVQSVTNRDGRVDEPLVSADEFQEGEYELLYYIGDYFHQKETNIVDPPFLNRVSVRVSLSAAEAHYHIPLLISPWGYQVYRGS
ncbi:hydroxyisourate hydrolase [Domibacillus sp. A3M-37]|uniref:hydroxyisourate hydrolase n=1 Tax=Domibacillus TaxID=1433999 RepID=UPI0006181963|nr:MULTISPECIES: hydroxyisourate hydrolase [Domibacillus]MCP3763610.1 hydroxyisourate hydrolase [Domibacillus sp. A3M-37]